MSQASFRMIVEDAFPITSRGTVVVGKVESGSAQNGDEVMLLSSDMKPLATTTIRSIPMTEFQEEADCAILLYDETIHDIAEQGMLLISHEQ